MEQKPLKPIRRGDAKISAGNLNEAFNRIEAAGRSHASSGASFIQDGSGSLSNPDPAADVRMLIRILSGTNPYAWEPVNRGAVTGQSTDYNVTDVGASADGSDGMPAYERNNNTAVPAGAVVEATVNGFLSCLEFDGGPPDTSATVRGVVNLTRQQLGHGVKSVEALLTGPDMSTGGIPGTYWGGLTFSFYSEERAFFGDDIYLSSRSTRADDNVSWGSIVWSDPNSASIEPARIWVTKAGLGNNYGAMLMRVNDTIGLGTYTELTLDSYTPGAHLFILQKFTAFPNYGYSISETDSTGTTTTGDGKWGTDALGNIFSGGICTHVGTGSISGYTDEQAQDAVGSILTDTATIDATYDDAGNAISFDVKANSIDVAKMHASATSVLFGRTSAGAGAGEEITIGTGVATALGVNTGSAGAFVVNGGALGTPSGGTLTNCTGLPVTGISGETTVGGNFITLANPSAITFPRINADNSVSALSASAFLTAIGGASNALTSAHIFVGNVSNVATDVAMSGDATIDNTGAVTISKATGGFALPGTLSPATITGDQNNYNPGSVLTYPTWRLLLDAAHSITGIDGSHAAGSLLLIHNTSVYTLTLVNNSGSSTAANRFTFGNDLVLDGQTSVLLQYDSTSSCWRAAAPRIPLLPNFLAATDTDLADLIFEYDTSAAANKSITVERLLALAGQVVKGRLTLETGVPISTTDQSAKGTLYFTPFQGNRVRLYDGTRWKIYSFSEVSLSLSISDATNYYVYLYDNAGTLTLETSTTATVLQDGVPVKSGATTKLYLGMIRGSAANQTSSTLRRRYVSNFYNAVPMALFSCPAYTNDDATSSYSYTSTSFAPCNAGTDDLVEFVLAYDGFPARAAAVLLGDVSAGQNLAYGISYDSTTQPKGVEILNSGTRVHGCKPWEVNGTAGYHYFSILARVSGGTGTIYSDLNRNGAAADPYMTYLTGNCWG